MARHLEECASLRRCHVSLLLPASFTVDRQVEHDLIPVAEEIVESIDLRPGVRKRSASAHHPMEVVVMLRVERHQDRDDRVPRVGTPGHDPVAADVAGESIVDGENRSRFLSIRRRIGRDRRAVEDTRVSCEPGTHEIDVHLRELLRRYGGARFHQHFEPHAETIGVELLVQARLAGVPQVEIKDTRQLVGCR